MKVESFGIESLSLPLLRLVQRFPKISTVVSWIFLSLILYSTTGFLLSFPFYRSFIEQVIGFIKTQDSAIIHFLFHTNHFYSYPEGNSYTNPVISSTSLSIIFPDSTKIGFLFSTLLIYNQTRPTFSSFFQSSFQQSYERFLIILV